MRSKIIKEHLNDPAYFESMSALLDEIIAARKAKAMAYEEYLKKIAELARRVEAGQADDTPKQLNTPGRRALYNNLLAGASAGGHRTSERGAAWGQSMQDEALALAIRIDDTVKQVRPDEWRGHQARENQIKREALLPLLNGDVAEVERIFLIIKQQREY